MAHTRKQGGKELLWMLGIPTVIAAGTFYWFINDADSQFAAKPSYVASTSDSTTPDAAPVTITPNTQTSQPTLATQTATPEASAQATTTTQTEVVTPETPPEQTATKPAPVPNPETAASNFITKQTVASEITPPAITSPATTEATATAQNEQNDVVTPTAATPEPPIDTTATSEVTTTITTTTVEPGASGAAGPSDASTNNAPANDAQYTVQIAPPVQTDMEPANVESTNNKPTDTGWIYIGQFRNSVWKSSGFDILDQMPKVGEKYTLTWGANIRAQPPVKRTVAGETPQLAENVGYLAIGKQVEVLNIRRSGNKGHIWVEIPR